ncbi:MULTISPECIES: 3-hydroxyacyl-ACP dehydratase FabZ family protein [Bacillus]|uniref:Hydroxymyristoyl-(Acyl carrier protein) dehydratase n=2 Tax=Bacillus inaquosorum TaxID=483913 RepID=A0A9W5LGF0_9BACI|nr:MULTISPECIES: 3-hydroxyacyl-ACP dehydratase FabZ family protein [Bacillus]ARV45427.1 beta-hydroxyacyl-ACP dehydratase [Bacillus subtilis]AMA51119.1 beta-hydroxyacyl-ACP dehydratase [Bacillus inaquosorum]AWM15751.1 beta-hydroxyacyl-ACP dehydratase [Bacillus inaquosorum]ELS60156.1 putative hydroxymyristoyl-(acyl carrier protein) dehydratase [Bacillus inaquosorum KCTC 13429]MBT2191770.1 beta-hydroxyacyl-ACP dehydratase [Bacillus inaquosorum]
MNSLSLPHRYPFLFIDGVTETEPGKHAAAYKLVSENDWFITDTQTEMPFSLVIEALAQTAAFTGITDENSLGLLSSVKKAEKLGAAIPGDRLDLTFEVTRNRRGFVFGHAKASVGGQPVAEAEIGIYIEK